MTESTDTPQEKKSQELSFTVQSIDCIACSPVFRGSLGRTPGIVGVKEFPITNKIVVLFDGAVLNASQVSEEITRIAKRAGLAGKIIFAK